MLMHVRQETEYNWLFQCLLCPEYNPYDTIYNNNLKRHFANSHTNIKPKVGSNYIDRSKEALPLIKKMLNNCFNGQPIQPAKMQDGGEDLTEKHSKEKMFKCNKCGLSTSSGHRYRHGVLHLKR